MKMRFSFLSVLFFVFCISDLSASELLRYTVIKNPYRFTTYFEMHAENGYVGRVVKDSFRVRTTYDLYDSKGDEESQGICRALSLGVVYPWAREIDVYDSMGSRIGYIDGKVFTTAHAKFNLYDGEKNRVAIAYLDQVHSGFVLMDASHEERTVGYLKRNVTEKKADDWEVVLYDSKALDSRLLKIFSAFVVDNQDSF